MYNITWSPQSYYSVLWSRDYFHNKSGRKRSISARESRAFHRSFVMMVMSYYYYDETCDIGLCHGLCHGCMNLKVWVIKKGLKMRLFSAIPVLKVYKMDWIGKVSWSRLLICAFVVRIASQKETQGCYERMISQTYSQPSSWECLVNLCFTCAQEQEVQTNHGWCRQDGHQDGGQYGGQYGGHYGGQYGGQYGCQYSWTYCYGNMPPSLLICVCTRKVKHILLKTNQSPRDLYTT